MAVGLMTVRLTTTRPSLWKPHRSDLPHRRLGKASYLSCGHFRRLIAYQSPPFLKGDLGGFSTACIKIPPSPLYKRGVKMGSF